MSRLFNPGEYLQYNGTNLLGGDEEPVTMSFWYKANASETGDCMLGILYDNSAPTAFWMARAAFTTEWRAYANDGSTTSYATRASTPRNAWTHVLAEYVSSGARRIYVDNTAGSDDTTGVYPTAEVNILAIGPGPYGGAGLTHDVRVAEFAIWKRTLTSGERSDLQTKTPDVAASGALEYWPLADGGTLVGSVNGWTLADGGTASAFDADHPSLSGASASRFWRDRKRTYLSPWLRR
jgi:hypothetical protein